MSYYSHVYRHRNPNLHDENTKEPFFAKQNDTNKPGQKSAFFQAKLSVNEPGDTYEREADSVANTVVNHQNSSPDLQQKKISSIQRLSTPMNADVEKEKKKGIQKMDDPLKKEKVKKKPTAVQTKQDTSSNAAPANVSSQIENSSGKGNSLPKNTLHEMNSSFGVDFSDVKIHKDSDAVNMNKELQAQAFTHGRDVYFNEGKYHPENSEGKFLLAHELTHVVQQKGVDNIQKKDNKNKKKQKLPQNFICYTGGHNGIVSVFKNGVLIFSGDAVSGQPGSKQNEKGSGPTPDGTYVIHPQKTNSPVDKGQGGTCAADAISSGYQELSSNEKFPCDHPSHYCTESCSESPVNHCFTPVGCWGTKRIKIEGSAQVVTDDGKKITRSGFYFHGGNPSNLASSGCIKVLDNNFFTKARELKGSIRVFVGTTCPGLDLNAVLFPFKSFFDRF